MIALVITINTFKSVGNVLLNGFASDLSKNDPQVGLQPAHFNPISKWSFEDDVIVDESTQEEYCNDSARTVCLKCAALFAASWLVQPIGLSLNLLNRIAKIVTFAHLWHPSKENYNFKARIGEWGKDVLIVVVTPFILIGMIFSALYGMTIFPYSGRKLYATCERLAYSGGYQFFPIGGGSNCVNDYFLAPCFQPYPQAHLGGGNLEEPNVW